MRVRPFVIVLVAVLLSGCGLPWTNWPPPAVGPDGPTPEYVEAVDKFAAAVAVGDRIAIEVMAAPGWSPSVVASLLRKYGGRPNSVADYEDTAEGSPGLGYGTARLEVMCSQADPREYWQLFKYIDDAWAAALGDPPAFTVDLPSGAPKELLKPPKPDHGCLGPDRKGERGR